MQSNRDFIQKLMCSTSTETCRENLDKQREDSPERVPKKNNVKNAFHGSGFEMMEKRREEKRHD